MANEICASIFQSPNIDWFYKRYTLLLSAGLSLGLAFVAGGHDRGYQ